MNPNRPPPKLAAWLLSHLAGRYRRDALIGDLAEEYRHGRSGSWYWRQVLWALAASGRHFLSSRPPGFGFLLWWWTLLVLASFEWKWPVLIFALDPSPYLLYRRRRKQRRSQTPCVP